MEHGKVTAVVTVDVAIHAGIVGVFVGGKHFLIEVLDVPLPYFHFIPNFVGRFYQSVTEVTVYLIFAYCPLEGRIAYPFPFFQSNETDGYCFSLIRFQKLVPFLQRETYVSA